MPTKPSPRQLPANAQAPAVPAEKSKNATTSKDRYLQKFGVLSDAAVGGFFTHAREPHRVQRALREWAYVNNQPFHEWNALQGWLSYTDDPEAKPKVEKVIDPMTALKWIADMDGDGKKAKTGVFLIHWPHFYVDKIPAMMHCLKHYCREFTTDPFRRLVLLSPEGAKLPLEIEHDVVQLDLDLPTRDELRVIYNSVIGSLSNGSATSEMPYTEEQVHKIVEIGAGMTETEFEVSVSTAIIENRETWPRTPLEDFVKIISVNKTAVIKKSDVLELMDSESMDNIGGLDGYKDWIRMRRKCFTKEAQDFGVDRPKGVVAIGPPGCLAWDTPMSYVRGERNSGRPILLRELYRKFNGIQTDTRGWGKQTPTFLHSFCHETGKLFYNRIVSVIDAGWKPVMLLTTTGGRSLKLTSIHPVLTPDGFVEAGRLTPGQTVIVRGSMKTNPAVEQYGRKPRVTVEGLKFYASGWRHVVKDGEKTYTYFRQHRARLVVEAHMNGMAYDDYVHRLKTDPEAITLKTLSREMAVHHSDENPMNDELGNLLVLFKPEHDRLHSDESNFNVEYTALDTVESVVPYGTTHTYDIEMETPGNNFATEDGLLVHNTGKTLLAKATASPQALNLPLVKLDISKVFNSKVGESEARVRAALKQLEVIAPCVVLFDEVDKGLGGAHQGNNDSGVSQRVLGTILTFIQENKHPIFWVLTANRAHGLDPALLRRGRMDEVFSVMPPNAVERLAVLKIHLRKRKQNPDILTDLDLAVIASEGFVSAEIESAVADAITVAFDQSLPINGALIKKQMGTVKPISVAFKDDFDMMSEWAINNARPASITPPKVADERVRTAPASNGATAPRRQLNLSVTDADADEVPSEEGGAK